MVPYNTSKEVTMDAVRKQVYISKTLDRALRRISGDEGLSESEVMRRALEHYFSELGIEVEADPILLTIGLAGDDGPGTGSLRHDEIYNEPA
jgi:hypothetical protein